MTNTEINNDDENGLLPYQQRVVSEKAELDDRLGKLNTFLDTSTFNAMHNDERARMIRQHYHMVELSKVLGERVDAFLP